MKAARTFIFSGGLGNQLFQFAALHYFALQNGTVYRVYFPTPLDGARDFDLARLCVDCDHISEVIRKRSVWLEFRCKLKGFLKYRNTYLHDVWGVRLVEEESSTYTFQNALNGARVISGYFQHWRYVAETREVISSELGSELAHIFDSLSEEVLKQSYGVLHFRQGDLLSYVDTMGLLEQSYYLDAIDKALASAPPATSLVVLSDDISSAVSCFGRYTNHIYGPEHFTAWESLAVMSRANFVIASNSTFSWWGSLFSYLRQGKVYIPSPWFKNWKPDPKEAFNFPGFTVLKSRFKQ